MILKLDVLVDVNGVSSELIKNYSRISTYNDRAIVLNSLMRNAQISRETVIKKSLTDKEYIKVSRESGSSIDKVKSIVSAFLRDLSRVRSFYMRYIMTWDPNLKNLERKVRCYLHKLHRLAPVFDYKRARVNLGILLEKLKKMAFWPKISTQTCLVIFITDVLDKDVDEFNRLIQCNIRTLCGCSAYAFHRSRNKLKINP